MLRPIVAPTVPKGADRVRLCLHAGNTVAEVDGLCRTIEEWACQKMGIDFTGVKGKETCMIKSSISHL